MLPLPPDRRHLPVFGRWPEDGLVNGRDQVLTIKLVLCVVLCVELYAGMTMT